MYDFAHCLSDYIEGVTHSVCTLEFEVHRSLYDWILENLDLPRNLPHQYEFARLNLTYTVLSKRKLMQLVEKGSSPDGTTRGCPRSPDCAAAVSQPVLCVPSPTTSASPNMTRTDRRRSTGARHPRRVEQDCASASSSLAPDQGDPDQLSGRSQAKRSTRSTTRRRPPCRGSR